MRIQTLIAVPVAVLGLIAVSAFSIHSEMSRDANVLGVKSAHVATADLATAYAPIPENPYELSPAERKSLDFGILSSVTTANGVITLHVDRTNFYQGAEVAAHSKDESRDWVTEDTDGEGKELTFTLDPKTSVQAEASLRNDHDNGSNVREKLTPAQVVTNMNYLTKQNAADPDDASTTYVWLRHADGADGPVTAMVDQFIP